MQKFLLVDEVRAVLGETEEASKTRKRKNGLPQGGLLTNSASVDTRVCTTLWHGSKPSVLQFSQVSASWSGNADKCVLKDINFEVNKVFHTATFTNIKLISNVSNTGYSLTGGYWTSWGWKGEYI